MRNTLCGILVLLCIGSHLLWADMTVKDYRERFPQGQLTPTDTVQRLVAFAYIEGVGHGIQTASVVARIQGNKQLYCIPDKLILTGENYMGMIDREIKEQARIEPDEVLGKRPLGVVLLYALTETFACPSK